MHCGSPTEDLSPKFCSSCGQPFYKSSNSKQIISAEKETKYVSPTEEVEEYEEIDEFLLEDIDESKLGFEEIDIQDFKSQKITIGELSKEGKPSSEPIRDLPPVKKQSKKAFLEEFKKQAGTLRK